MLRRERGVWERREGEGGRAERRAESGKKEGGDFAASSLAGVGLRSFALGNRTGRQRGGREGRRENGKNTKRRREGKACGRGRIL